MCIIVDLLHPEQSYLPKKGRAKRRLPASSMVSITPCYMAMLTATYSPSNQIRVEKREGDAHLTYSKRKRLTLHSVCRGETNQNNTVGGFFFLKRRRRRKQSRSKERRKQEPKGDGEPRKRRLIANACTRFRARVHVALQPNTLQLDGIYEQRQLKGLNCNHVKKEREKSLDHARRC